MLVSVFQLHLQVNLRRILHVQSVLEQVLFDPVQVPNPIFLSVLLGPNVQIFKRNQSNKEMFKKMFIFAILATFDKKNVKTCHTTEIYNFISFDSKFSKFDFSKSSP